MVAYNLVNIGQDNGLLPDGTRPLPETVFHRKCSKVSIFDMSLKITNLRSQQHLPGANELTIKAS